MNIVSWLETLNGLGFKTAWVLLSLLWQSSILLAAAGLLAFVLRRKRASVRHAVWIIALLAAPALPLLGWFGSYLNAPQAEIPVVPSYSVPHLASPAPKVELYEPPRESTLPPPIEAEEESKFSIFAYPWALAFIIYATGLILFLSLVIAGRFRIGRWIRKGVVVRDTRVLGAFQTARQHFGLKRPFLLVEGKDVQAPMTIRTFRPVVLLPTGLTQSLSDAELKAVAIHEMAHIKRNDGLLLTLASFVRAVLFFHPLVWLACRQISLLAEQVADDAVLEATGEALPYAQMLARLAEGLTRRSLSTELAAGILISKSAFLRRVEAILSDRRDQICKLSRLALLGTILATLVSLVLATALPLGEKSPAEAPEFKQVRYFASPIFWRVDGYGKVTFDGELASPGGGFWKVYYSAPNIIDKAEWYDSTGLIIKYAISKYDQEGNIKQISTYYPYGDLERRENFSYDKKGRVAEVFLFGRSGKLSRSTRYKYDAEGKKKEVASYDSKGMLKETYKFIQVDDKGRVLESNHYDAQGKFKRSLKYKYDQAGRLVEYWDSTDLSYTSPRRGEHTTQNKYNDQGWLVESATYDVDGKLRGSNRYKYTEDGRLLERLRRSSTMVGGERTFVHKYKYDEEGHILESTLSDGKISKITKYNEFQRQKQSIRYDEEGKVTRRWEYDYDEKGRQIETRRYRPDGSLSGITKYNEFQTPTESIRYDEKGRVENKWEHEYDEEGRQIEARRYDAEGLLRQITKYNEFQRQRESILYDEKGKVKNKLEYEHDEKGRQIESRLYGPDGKLQRITKYNESLRPREDIHYDEKEKVKERWEYEYDEEGRRIKTRRYGPDGQLIEEKATGGEGKGAKVPEEAAASDMLSNKIQEIFDRADKLAEERKQRSREYLNSLSDEELARIYARSAAQQVLPFNVALNIALKAVKKDRREIIGNMEGFLSEADKTKFIKRRSAIVDDLANLGPDAVPTLVLQLGSTPRRARGWWLATEALLKMGPRIVPHLLPLMEKQDRALRANVASLLSRFADPRAKDVLLQALKDEDGSVRRDALQGLVRMGPEIVGRKRLINLLIYGLQDGVCVYEAIPGLREYGDETALEALKVVEEFHFGRGKGDRRYAARQAINAILKRAGKPVKEAPREHYTTNRLTYDDLLQAAQCPNAGIRRGAVTFLQQRYRDDRTALFLIDRLAKEQNAGVTEEISRWLGIIMLPPSDPQESVVSAPIMQKAFDGLLSTAEAAASPRIKAAAISGATTIVHAARRREEHLDRIDDLKAIVGEGLSSKEPRIQRACFRAVTAVAMLAPEKGATWNAGERKVLQDQLVPFLNVPTPNIRLIECLGYIGDKELTPRMLELLKHSDSTVRRFAAAALGKIGDMRAVEPLIDLLKDESSGVRGSAVTALGEIGDPRALPALRHLAETDPAQWHDGTYGVREAAKSAIQAIQERVGKAKSEKAEAPEFKQVRYFARPWSVDGRGKVTFDGELASPGGGFWKVYYSASDVVDRAEQYTPYNAMLRNVIFKYDQEDRISEIEGYRYGAPWMKQKFSYDEKGQLAEVAFFGPTGKLSNTQRYKYDAEGQMKEMLVYDSKGVLEGTTKRRVYENGRVVESDHYDAEGKLKNSFKDEYDDAGRQVEYWHGKEYTGKWEEGTTKNKYNDQGWLVERATYNADGKLGNLQKYKYAEDGRILERSSTWTQDDGERTVIEKFEYDDEGRIVDSTEHFDGRLGRIRKYNESQRASDYIEIEYDREGNISQRTEYEFDEKGRQTQRRFGPDGKLQEILEYGYDEEGRLIRRFYGPDGTLREISGYGRDEKGRQIKRLYGPDDRLERITKYDEFRRQRESILYDDKGNVKERWEYDYDEQGRQVERRLYGPDAKLREAWEYEYDEKGWRIRRHYGSDGKLQEIWEYDTFQRLKEGIRYDKEGKISQRREYEYDEQGRRIETRRYGPDGELIEKEDAGGEGKGAKTSEEAAVKEKSERPVGSEAEQVKKAPVPAAEVPLPQRFQTAEFRAIFQEARTALDERRFDDAAQELLEIIERHPEDRDILICAYMGLGNAKTYSQKYRAAIEDFKKVTALVPKEDESYLFYLQSSQLRVGFCHYNLGEYEEAITICQELIEKYPEPLGEFGTAETALSYVVRSYKKQNQYDKMLFFLDEVINKYPNKELAISAIYEMADYYRHQKDFEKAIGLFEEITRLRPDTLLAARVYLIIADCQERLALTEDAEAARQKAVDAAEGYLEKEEVRDNKSLRANGLFTLGRALRVSKRYSEAIVALEELADSENGYRRHWQGLAAFALAEVYEAENDLEKALEYYRKFVSEFPEKKERARIAQGKVDILEKKIKKGDITEIDEQVFENAGQLLREKKFMEAVEELKTIAETYKDKTGDTRYIFFKARWLLAETYIELGDSAGGRKILLALIPELEGKMGPRIYQHYPAGFQTYCLCISSIGLSYQTEGKFAEAEEWYEKCRDILLAERRKIEAQGEAYPYPKLNDWIEGRLRANNIMIANVRKWKKVSDEVVLLLHEPNARVTPFGHSQNILLYKADWADSEKLWENLFLYSLTEGKKIDLTSGRISGHIYAYFPPNSNFVIFSGIGIEDDNHHLYTYSLDAGTFNEISIALPTSYIGPLSATADGKVIVFEALYPDETGLNMDISIMDSSDGSVRRLTNHPAKDRHPDISPDGQYVAFYSMRGTTDHGYDIYMVKADGTGEVRRLTTDMEAAYPSWLPDGKAIIFVSFLKGSRGIWKVSPDGGEPTQIFSGYVLRAVVSNDGQALTFTRGEKGHDGNLYLLELTDK